MERTVTVGDLQGRTAADVLRQVVRQGEPLTVVIDEYETVEIRPKPRLKPLPKLEGQVPQGWKDALYGR